MRIPGTSRALSPAGFVLAAAVLLAACAGGDDDGGTAATVTGPPPSIAGPQPQPFPAQPLDSGQTAPQGGVIEISARDSLFVPNNLVVDVGAAVVLRVTNEDGVTHNLRLAGTDGEFDTEDDAVTLPEQVAPGQVGEMTFAPPAAGYYTFRCDFHPQSMGGLITVGEPEGEPPTPEPAPSPAEDGEEGGAAGEETGG